MANQEIYLRFICETSLSECNSVIVKEKGVKTLLKSAEKRGNREHVRILKKISSVTVHTACQKSYNNDKLISAYCRKQVIKSSDASTSRRSSIPSFNFKTHCFLCTDEITVDFLNTQRKLNVPDRDIIFQVEKLDVKETILKAAEKRGDEWGQQIIQRIQHVTDLVAVEGRYHKLCQKRLYSRVKTEHKRGYRPATNVDEAMEYIYSYLDDNSEECQFCLDDLMNQIDGEYRPDPRTVKSRLLKKYEEDILSKKITNRL